MVTEKTVNPERERKSQSFWDVFHYDYLSCSCFISLLRASTLYASWLDSLSTIIIFAQCICYWKFLISCVQKEIFMYMWKPFSILWVFFVIKSSFSFPPLSLTRWNEELYLTVKSQKTHENYKIKHVRNQTVSSSEESLVLPADQNSKRRQHFNV